MLKVSNLNVLGDSQEQVIDITFLSQSLWFIGIFIQGDSRARAITLSLVFSLLDICQTSHIYDPTYSECWQGP